jgi:cell fate regulator YaaT (PSP1 superfamily)
MHSAKVQDLPLNPQRLSGQCGRLKCCLNYELEQYLNALKHLPRVGKMVATPRGKGQVDKVDIFRSLVWIRFSDGSLDSFTAEDLAPRS